MKKVIERGNTTMCQMFGGFFNKNFGKFINTNLEILLSTEPFTLKKIPWFYICLPNFKTHPSFAPTFLSYFSPYILSKKLIDERKLTLSIDEI